MADTKIFVKSSKKSFSKWEIWDFGQAASRANSEHQQPLDPNKPNRRFLIISDNALLKNAHSDTKILRHPIGENQINTLFAVPLIAGQAGCTKNCFIWCHEIYTLKAKYFYKKYGSAESVSDKIKLNQKILLDLR